MVRLPVPQSDYNSWGDLLNAFLNVDHNSDGTLKLNVANVKGSFGALGDGSTNDTVAIQNAINSLSSGIVYVPPGTYGISASGITPKANVIVVGSGARSSVFKVVGSPSGSKMVDATGDQTGWGFFDLGFDGQSNTTMYKAIETGGATGLKDIRIERCYFTDWQLPTAWDQTNPDVAAILLYSSSNTMDKVRISNSEFNHCQKPVRVYYPTGQIHISGNRMYNTATAGMQAGIETAGSSVVDSGLIIERNHIVGANYDPSGDPGGQIGCGVVIFNARGVNIVDNHIEQCGDPASQQASAGGVGARASLGGGVLLSNGSEGAKVVGNEIHDCQQHCIYVETSLSASTSVGTGGVRRGSTITGNHCWNVTGISNAASNASRAAINGINVNYAAGTTITGNVVHDIAHNGICTDSDRCVISGNIVSNTWQAVIPSVAPTLGTAVGTLTTGSYTVVYTYVFDSTKGQQSVRSPSATISVNGSQAITVGALSSIPNGVTAVRMFLTATPGTVGYTGVSATVTANATSSQTINAQGNAVSPPDYAVDKGAITIAAGNRSQVLGNQCWDNQTTGTQKYGVALNSGNHLVGGNDFTGNVTSAIFVFAGGTTNKFVNNGAYNPVGNITAPAIPSTTVAYTNQFGVDCEVHVTGGTVTVIAVGGVSTGLTSGSFRVPQNQTITLTYSVSPSWKWYGD